MTKFIYDDETGAAKAAGGGFVYDEPTPSITPTPARPEQGFTDRALGLTGSTEFTRAKHGAGEAALALGTGGLASVLGGYVGMAGAALPGPEGQGRDWSEAVQNALTYRPESPQGAKYLNTLSLPAHWLAAGGERAGGATAEASGSPALGAGVNAAIQTAPALIPMGLKGAKAVRQNAAVGDAAEAMFDIDRAAPVMADQTPLLERGARRLMQASVKPNLEARTKGRAEPAITTMLEEGINPTKGGMEKLTAKIEAVDDALTKVIENSTQNVDAYRVAIRAKEAFDRAKNQVNSRTDIAAVVKSLDEFLSDVNRFIPVQEAQSLKRGTYSQLGGKAYGEVGTASVDTQKQIARGLKEEIASAEPAAGPLNADLSRLINAREVLAPRVAVEGNKQVMGLGGPMGITEKGVSPGALIWLLERSPWLMGPLARMMYGASKAPVGQAMGGANVIGTGAEEARR